MITRDTIEEIRNHIDIVDVVSDFVTLKKAGQNYRALSPFNNEKTPSFYVVPSKGIFKDFSSGKGGDAITFIMEHEGLSYPEALRYLAKKYNVTIKEEQLLPSEQEEATQKESLYLVMGFARDHFRHNLQETDEGRGIGLSYFRERGFNDRTLEKFELGYALDSWDDLTQVAIQKGYSQDILDKAGLRVVQESKSYDRFRGRVIFPVHNLAGKVIAFGARILSKEKKENQPKYINSPETEIYHKSKALYGMYQARNAIRQSDNCFLVEGYTDVISMHQAGVENVVAASGTALTEEQVKLIRRFTDNVTVVFDGDDAGIRAAIRGIDLLLSGGLNVKVVLLPDGHDPDSFSKSTGTTALLQYFTQQARDFISFKASLQVKDAGSDPIKRAESIRSIVQSISLIPDALKRTVYVQETARTMGMPEGILLTELNKVIIREKRSREREAPEQEVSPLSVDRMVQDEDLITGKIDPEKVVYEQERETIRLLLNYAEETMEETNLADFLIHELEDVQFSNPLYSSIYSTICASWMEGKKIDSRYILENSTSEVSEAITGLITRKYDISENWDKKYHIYIPKDRDVLGSLALGNVNRLKFRLIQRMLRENLDKIGVAEKAGDVSQLDDHLRRHQQLKDAEKELAQALGIVVAG